MNNEIQLTDAELARRAAIVAGRAHNRVGIGIFLFILLPQVLATLAVLVAAFINPTVVENIYFVYGVQFVALYLITTPLALFAIGRPPAWVPAAPKTHAPPAFVLTVSCLLMSVSVGGSIFSNVLMTILGVLTGHFHENTTAELVTETPLCLILLLVVIIGPLCEELVFRRALMNRLLPFGELGAILVSGITFGLMHGNMFQLFYTMGIGILLAYIYAKTRNFLYPLFLHMGFNFIGSVLPMAYINLPLEELVSNPLAFLSENVFSLLVMLLHLFLMYGGALMGLILLSVFYNKIHFSPALISLRGSAQFSARFCNAGMILFFILGVGLLGLSLILT